MEITSITSNKPLIIITTYDNDLFTMEKTMEEYDTYLASIRDIKTSLIEFESSSGKRFRVSNIKGARNASPVEYFFHYIAKQIEPSIIYKLNDSLSRLSESKKESLTLEAITDFIQRERDELRTFRDISKKFTPEELERRKKQAEEFRRKLYQNK